MWSSVESEGRRRGGGMAELKGDLVDVPRTSAR